MTEVKAFLLRFIPSKVWLWGALAFVGALFVALVRDDARRDARKDDEIEDFKDAEKINRRVSDARRADDSLRKYDDAGWRD